MYRIIQRRNILFTVSLVLLVPGVVALSVWGLRLGIDFTGGSQISLDIASQPSVEEVRQTLAEVDYPQAVVVTTGQSSFDLRLPHLTNDQHQAVLSKLRERFNSAEERAYETVGPTIGKELQQRSTTALIVVLVAIILYVTWAFRRVSIGPVPSWVYGVSTLLALVHDVFMVVGAFAIAGHYFAVEINSLFVTALLTVLGFSVHDTIVVFDRIRERLRLSGSTSFEEIVNESLNQTMVRSINTSVTTLLVLIALFLFGGEAIRHFILALIIGIASGTYSSIFVASPLLVVYERARRRR